MVSVFAPHNVPGGGGAGWQAVAAQPPLLIEQHENAGLLLVEIIRVSRDALITASPTERLHNPLLTTAESSDMISVSTFNNDLK